MDSMTLFIASLAVSVHRCARPGSAGQGPITPPRPLVALSALPRRGAFRAAAGIQAVLGDVTAIDTVMFFPFARFQLLLNRPVGRLCGTISVLAFAGSTHGLNSI